MEKIEAYRKAEEKIEKARLSGAKKLDLSIPGDPAKSNVLKLSELPESLYELTQLQSLNLSNNELPALPESLSKLSQLQSLNLSNNRLTELPDSLKKLTRIKSLLLYGNQLTMLPEWVGKFTQLLTLDVSHNQLTKLPDLLGKLTQLQSLDISDNQLKELPDTLEHLTGLKHFSVRNNALVSLPRYVGDFSQLRTLNLYGNQLKSLPDNLRQLSGLETLQLGPNALTSLPEWLGELKHLKLINLRENRLTELPKWISQLERLESLYVSQTTLETLPTWIAQLTALETIYASKNHLSDLPASLVQLTKLESINLDNNPLNPVLAAAHKKGIDSIRQYLHEMEKGAQSRYEAKLLILGDGNEGKTCVSRALRRLPFRKQNTTRGVDVVQWKFPHPDHAANSEKEITLNIWDFEGQEISHQTHQFFLTSQSLYLLVFKCRDLFLLDRAEYWLDTIRARAPQAKVAIVISQCEGRSPVVPLDRIQAQYGDLLAEEWFFPVGCENGANIPQLASFLKRWAADLEFMGSLWPASYGKAETAIKSSAKRGAAHITRDKLNAIFARSGVSHNGYDDAAAALARLGLITQFPDCPDLNDFIVLRPQWLTKAISNVMEDYNLSTDKGETTLQNMEAMWQMDYPGMFATFHDCMKEFELCYDIEDGQRSCLVPLRFGYLRPAIPWSNCSSMKERRVEYKLNIRPPMGIMSRFIVKTHHMIVKTESHPKGIYWHNGVFLSSGDGPLRSEALCEFIPEERKLRIEVRAAYPQNMCEQMHAYVKAVFSFFSGLEAERSYGCIKIDATSGAEEKCIGLHTERRIYTAISKQRPTFDCEFEDHEVDPRTLVGGFGSFNEFVIAKVVSLTQLRRELDKQPEWATPYLCNFGTLLDWTYANGEKLDQLLQNQSALPAEFKQEAELKLHEYLTLTSQMLDDRDFTTAPGLISINTKDRSKWNPTSYFKKTYLLTPYCECPGNIHPCLDGRVEFTREQEWWTKSTPWIARGTKLLSVGLQLAFAGMPLAVGSNAVEGIKDDVDFMDKLAEHIELKEGDETATADIKVVTEDENGNGENDKETRLARTALAQLLQDLAPTNYRARQWGSLHRVRMSDDTHRWLCEDCAKHSH